MIIPRLALRAGTAAILAVTLTVGPAEIASASTLRDTSVAAPTAQIDKNRVTGPAALESDDSDNLTDQDMEALDNALQAMIKEKAERGEVAYSVSDDGNIVYTTDIPFGENNTPLEIVYELAPGTHGITELSRAHRSHHVVHASGNEWYPKIWFGKDSHGRWVRFNRAAQSLMISGGGTALKASICAIPVVDEVGCALVWIATMVAKKVMKHIGRCPTTAPWLYAYPTNVRASQCRVF